MALFIPFMHDPYLSFIWMWLTPNPGGLLLMTLLFLNLLGLSNLAFEWFSSCLEAESICVDNLWTLLLGLDDFLLLTSSSMNELKFKYFSSFFPAYLLDSFSSAMCWSEASCWLKKWKLLYSSTKEAMNSYFWAILSIKPLFYYFCFSSYRERRWNLLVISMLLARHFSFSDFKLWCCVLRVLIYLS